MDNPDMSFLQQFRQQRRDNIVSSTSSVQSTSTTRSRTPTIESSSMQANQMRLTYKPEDTSKVLIQSNGSSCDQQGDPYILQKRSFFWDFLLKTYEKQTNAVKNDSEITSIREKQPLPNQKVIKTDALRTRPQQFDDSLRDKLEIVLTAFCDRKSITYKQGLNEVAGPFVYFLNANSKLSTIYNYFETFMDRFIPTLYNDTDFHSLQCYFNLFSLLIKYHDPELHSLLEENFITPELYATPWFLTLFANKMSLQLLYYFWEIYIVENDCHFVFFVSLAFLLFNKQHLLSGDLANLPQKLTQLQIGSVEQLKAIYKLALELKSKTPISFGMKIRSMQLFFKEKCSSDPQAFFERMQVLSQQIEQTPHLPIYPLELLQQQMPEKFTCGNIFCISNRELFRKLKETQQSLVFQPQNGGNTQRISNTSSYFELSEQIGFGQFQKDCDDCKAKNLEKNENNIRGFLKDNPVLLQLLEQQREHYKQQKEKQDSKTQIKHVIFDLRKIRQTGSIPSIPVNLTNNTESQLMQVASQYALKWESQKGQVLISFLVGEISLGANPSGVGFTEEEQKIQIFLEAFKQKNYPYIGIIEGGFKLIHAIFKASRINVPQHDEKLCPLCTKQPPKVEMKKSKSKNLFEIIADAFAFTDDEEQQQSKDINQKEKQIQQIRSVEVTPLPAPSYLNIDTKLQSVSAQNQKMFQTQNGEKKKEIIVKTAGEREETLSNCVENDNEDVSRLIQQSTFQVKHSTPNKPTGFVPGSNRIMGYGNVSPYSNQQSNDITSPQMIPNGIYDGGSRPSTNYSQAYSKQLSSVSSIPQFQISSTAKKLNLSSTYIENNSQRNSVTSSNNNNNNNNNNIVSQINPPLNLNSGHNQGITISQQQSYQQNQNSYYEQKDQRNSQPQQHQNIQDIQVKQQQINPYQVSYGISLISGGVSPQKNVINDPRIIQNRPINSQFGSQNKNVNYVSQQQLTPAQNQFAPVLATRNSSQQLPQQQGTIQPQQIQVQEQTDKGTTTLRKSAKSLHQFSYVYADSQNNPKINIDLASVALKQNLNQVSSPTPFRQIQKLTNPQSLTFEPGIVSFGQGSSHSPSQVKNIIPNQLVTPRMDKIALVGYPSIDLKSQLGDNLIQKNSKQSSVSSRQFQALTDRYMNANAIPQAQQVNSKNNNQQFIGSNIKLQNSFKQAETDGSQIPFLQQKQPDQTIDSTFKIQNNSIPINQILQEQQRNSVQQSNPLQTVKLQDQRHPSPHFASIPPSQSVPQISPWLLSQNPMQGKDKQPQQQPYQIDQSHQQRFQPLQQNPNTIQPTSLNNRSLTPCASMSRTNIQSHQRFNSTVQGQTQAYPIEAPPYQSYQDPNSFQASTVMRSNQQMQLGCVNQDKNVNQPQQYQGMSNVLQVNKNVGNITGSNTNNTTNSNFISYVQSSTQGAQENKFQIQEDFDKETEAKQAKRYKRSGLVQSCIVSYDDHQAFFRMLERSNFSFYLCEGVKEGEQPKGKIPKQSRQILIVSTEYVLSLKYSQPLENVVAAIHARQQSIMRRLMQISTNEKKISQKIQVNQQFEGGYYVGRNECVKIKSFFLMRQLLKITSKKQDKTTHSFYFKLPAIFQSAPIDSAAFEFKSLILQFSFNQLYDLVTNGTQTKYSVLSSKNPSDFIESKTSLKIDTEESAAECIKMSQSFFSINKQNCIAAIY